MVDITEHLPLVEWCVNRRWRWAIKGRIEREDLVAAGREGLVHAARKFNPELGAFTTYAVYWINCLIRHHLQHYKRLVRIPVYLEERGPLPSERLMYLDAPWHDDEDRPSHERLGSVDPEQAIAVARKDVAQLIALLSTERARTVVTAYYIKGKTLQAIGDERGVTRERIRQILLQAVEELSAIARRKFKRKVVVVPEPLPAPAPALPQPDPPPQVSLGSRPKRTSEQHLTQLAKARARLLDPEVQAHMQVRRAACRSQRSLSGTQCENRSTGRKGVLQ